MRFIKKIREDLGLTKYAIGKKLGYSNSKSYINFENSKRAINVKKLVKLWRLSGLSGQEFMEMIEAEVMGKKTSKRK